LRRGSQSRHGKKTVKIEDERRPTALTNRKRWSRAIRS
jgi:hypothetical protein